MNSSFKIVQKAKDIFFEKHPDRKCQEKIRVVGEILEIIDTYFEAKRKTGSQKNRRQSLHKKGNYKFHSHRRAPRSYYLTGGGK